MEKKDVENLIGTKINVLDDNGDIVKEITIKNAKEINGGIIVTDEDGEIYDETHLEFRYSLTMGGLLAAILADNGIIEDIFLDKDFNKAAEEFMEGMIKIGYIKTNENDQ